MFTCDSHLHERNALEIDRDEGCHLIHAKISSKDIFEEIDINIDNLV